jgi:hypothetical protein
MQHWHIYRKWNECLFVEMLSAYKEGRSDKNPCDTWYRGELGFFDFYVIPLANKLKDCGVFGVSSDEYLNYAQKNRAEWELRGQEIVSTLVDKYGVSDETEHFLAATGTDLADDPTETERAIEVELAIGEAIKAIEKVSFGADAARPNDPLSLGELTALAPVTRAYNELPPRPPAHQKNHGLPFSRTHFI